MGRHKKRGPKKGFEERRGYKRVMLRYWNKTRCKREAMRFKSYSDFYTYSQSAYRRAQEMGWLKDYTWLERSHKVWRWSEETVMEEARKYNTRSQFQRGSKGAYLYAWRHGLLDKMDWFVEFDDDTVKFMNQLFGKIFRLLTSVGLSATKEWLLVESGKEDVYTENQRKLLKDWSGRVTKKWASWKKFKWKYYDEMNWYKDRKPGNEDELFIKD